MVCAHEVDLYLCRELVGRGLVGGADDGLARVRHEDLDGPERISGGSGQVLDRAGIGKIEAHGNGLTTGVTDLGRGRLAALDAARREDDGVTIGSEEARRRLADARR